MQREKMIAMLSAKRSAKRLKAIKLLNKAEERNPTLIPEKKKDRGLISVHTDYSFSPFTPSLAAYMAYKSGLNCVCISDHDTLSGVNEFRQACGLLGIECAAGVQLRAKFYDGKGVVLNNIYEKDVGFVSVRGISPKVIDAFNAELEPLRALRVERDLAMVEKFNRRLSKYGVQIDFEKDVKPLARLKEGGTITERHILYAFAQKLINKFVYADKILSFITDDLSIKVEGEYLSALSDTKNPYYAYDLVDCLKGEIGFFYIPDKDLLSAQKAVELAHKYGALISYCYVGHLRRVGEQAEEGSLSIKELASYLSKLGFDGLEFFPGTVEDCVAEELKAAAEENGLILVGCTDIHSPRQHFNAPAVEEDLVRNKWAIIGHEKCVEYDLQDGINTEKSKAKNPDLNARLGIYAGAGKN